MRIVKAYTLFRAAMEQTTEIAILPFKVQELADMIVEKKRLSIDDALFYLYNSELYRNLSDPALKLWYYSGAQLYELLEEEKSHSKKIKSNKPEMQFIVFCIEQYRLRHQLSSASVLALFIRLNVDRFLKDHFEVLHSQGTDYILHEIEMFIKRRR
ncbi:MAG: DUF3791 domain-containing protein [Bacteroidales bacterium]|nr:DUF3791 domain-containing protein [Bacteroidales bacterium]